MRLFLLHPVCTKNKSHLLTCISSVLISAVALFYLSCTVPGQSLQAYSKNKQQAQREDLKQSGYVRSDPNRQSEQIHTNTKTQPVQDVRNQDVRNNTAPDPNTHIAENISHSRGEEGGIVLLWPRVVPGTGSEVLTPQASWIQARLKKMIKTSVPGRAIDIRPEPERVCPQAGCKGVSVGALLVHHEEGCAVVALIGQPGRSSVRMVPWAGKVILKSETVPFREPPESYVTIRDLVPCKTILSELTEEGPAVEKAISESF